jgi:peptide/nickel transport system substrate-binding protein
MKAMRTGAVLATMSLGLTACAGASSAPSTGERSLADGRTFTMAISADPGNLDPHFTSLGVTVQLDMFLYDSLVGIDADGEMVPGLAGVWDGSATEATFTLRDGVTCADGTALTASMVADNINFVANPENASTKMGVYVPPGAQAVADDNAGTVTVKSQAPDAFLARNVGGLPIVCAKGMKDRGLLKQGADGTGMFTLGEAVPGDHYTLNLRDDYSWGPGEATGKEKGLPETVVLKVIGNESTAANLLTSGEVNAGQILGADRDRLDAAGLFRRDVVAPLGELLFNQQAGHPGADESVRRALTQGLDLESLGKVLSGGNGVPSQGMVAPGQGPCNTDLVSGNLPGFDVEAAKSALDAAGWEAGDGGVREKDGKSLSVTLIYATSYGPSMQAGVELVQKLWTELGVDVTLKGASDAEAGQIVIGGQGSWDVTVMPLGVTLPSQLVPYLSGPTPPNGANFAGIENDDYVAHVSEAATKPGDEGCDAWAAAEKSLFEHVDVVLFVDSVQPFFGKGAEFELSQGNVMPSSIRMYEG